jgi:primary-amine oxidase
MPTPEASVTWRPEQMNTSHPLDPLTADEILLATTLLADARGVGDGWRYASIRLIEPTKPQVARFEVDGDVPERGVVATVIDRATNTVYRAKVSLTSRSVDEWQHLPGVQPNFTVDEWYEVDGKLRANPAIVKALADRGITQLDLVFFDTWAYGAAVMPEKYRDRRLGWVEVWVRSQDGANQYAGPVNGLKALIDMNAMELLEIEDEFVVDRPGIMGEYVPRLVPQLHRDSSRRAPLKRLDITQPDGPSFTIEGHKLEWQNWSLRVGFNGREGMTLHAVSYNDHGKVRPIASKLSFSEMFVPYRDHAFDHYRRTAFDIGEWGLGYMTTSLELGCDCLGEIRYLDAVLHDSKGQPYSIKNAICIHEEDNGVGWKHVDAKGMTEVRRQRRLVVSFHVTVANYEYLTYWRFYEDGNIECEVRATGLMVVTHFPEGGSHPHGSLVDHRTYAPYHQHFLVARLDLDIDGTENTVYASETEVVPIGPDNPYGLSLRQRNTPLLTEADGMQDMDFRTQRAWKVVNTNKTTGLGLHPAYKLVPGAALPAMFDPSSPVLKRCRAIEHTLWVTPNSAEELWPAGEFVVQSGDDLGLPSWTEANRSIDNTDVVLWYIFGIHHITRPEDWPIMPVDTVSFWLKPVGFFDRNPSLDVAPRTTAQCGRPAAEPHPPVGDGAHPRR